MNSPVAEADIVGYSPPLSLWRLVEQHVASHETDEIKSMLGVGMVEETLELHEELQAFLEIWRDCRHSTNMDEGSKPVRLPEPPGMRDRLIQEIKFFIENVREKAQEQGRDESSTLSNYDQNIIDYALYNESRSSSCDPLTRPQSVIGRDGKEAPSCRYESPLSDRISSSSYSTLSEDVEAMADKLNILKLDEVVLHLRSHLLEEKEWLIQDLRFLQQCIEDENEVGLPATMPEPSIGELRGERLKLEKDMLSEVFTRQKSLHIGLQTLRPSSAKLRTPIVPSNAPLKAVHLTAPDGIVLAGNVPESVVIKAQQKLRETMPSGSEDSHSAHLRTRSSNQSPPVPVPKQISSKASARPSSASKFRSMITSSRSISDE